MQNFLKIAQLGQPVLRQCSSAVAVENLAGDRALQALGDQLLAVTRAADGVGLAAPQIGVPLRVIAIASRPNARYPHAPLLPPTLLFNPRLVKTSRDREQDWEGCLSVPGIRGRVWRHQTITVAYRDRHGCPQQRELTGFAARIVQHELDHLDGILFVDRLVSERDCFTEAEYQQLQKQAAAREPGAASRV
ncbi:MAG: peptide deformylase [Spirulinaceae cyanobacterium SM2_1_0]|nr:peptide deformylase [Spirulinaceae cyanobacterium SM2_1_0]